MNYGRYEVANEQDILGKGAMGIVYRAHDPSLNRQVAIKVLHKKLLYDDEAVNSFLKEATLNASLSHPNILTILDVGKERGEVYIAMELLEGKPLSKMMATLTEKEILSIGMQIADGLDFAHKKKVVHRDIKPANIMVLHDGQIKITDFGIAKGASSGDEHLETQTGVIKGTPAYMSPEQARGDSRNVDGRSDLFSLGVMLYEMTVKKRPFGGDGKDFMAVFGEILNKNPQEPCRVNEAVQRDVSAIIMKALQKDPARRFQNGGELYQALKACQRSGAPVAAQPNKKALIGAAAAGGVLLLAVGGFFLFGSGKKVAPAPPAPMASAPAPVAAPAPLPVPVPASPVQPGQGLHLPPTVAPGSQNASPPLPAPAPAPAVSAPAPKEPAPRVAETKPAKKPATPPKQEKKKTEQKKEAPPAPSGGSEPPVAKTPAASSTEFAFLKVGSSPSGAQVYVNGALKGMTPLKVRLNLGRYKVRLSRSGYQDASTSVTLDKMAEFPIMQELKPE